MDQAALIATWAGVGVATLFGLAGFIVGAIGITQARKARVTAQQANELAEEANGLAAEANKVAVEQAERANELHRIDWDFRWRDLGVYQVANLGPDDAHRIHIQVTVAHETETMTVDRLAAREGITLDFPKVRARLETAPAMSNGYRRGVPPVMIRHLVTWRSPLGNPRELDQTLPEGRLQ